jgi:hypothetical protein
MLCQVFLITKKKTQIFDKGFCFLRRRKQAEGWYWSSPETLRKKKCACRSPQSGYTQSLAGWGCMQDRNKTFESVREER